MDRVDLPISSNSPRSPRNSLLTRGVGLLALLGLMASIGVMGRVLWREWNQLKRQQADLQSTVIIGYQNITPNVSYAQRPADWFHDEDRSTLLWSGWTRGVGHGWFRIGRGELQPTLISSPMGRDSILAIDDPLTENDGGPIWERIPDEARVIGLNLAGVWCAYPLTVLDKVEVVNDTIRNRHFLLTYNPMVPVTDAVIVYEPLLDGQRVTMGLTGYLHQRQPLLYDRDSESLWVADDDALRAIAGQRKGTSLRRIARPVPISWGEWRSNFPRSRLLVGANRARRRSTL